MGSSILLLSGINFGSASFPDNRREEGQLYEPMGFQVGDPVEML